MAKPKASELQVGGRRIKVSNLDKVLYPASRFTKGQVIDYYVRVSDFLLPHLKDRPVTLKRYPDGIHGEFFYEKDAPSFTPDWVSKFPVPRHAGGSDICYILINDLPTLVWCANLASLELHPFLHRVPDLKSPTHVVFDLDPGEGSDVLKCAEVGLLLKALLERLKLQSFPKVSGSKGIQVYVPLNTPVSYGVTQPFARTVAQYLEREHPKLIVSEMAKSARSRKVFIDWSQNADFKTTVGVYSLRAKRDRPYVSVPVTWKELEEALRTRVGKPLYFEAEEALARFEQVGDLFAPVLELKQRIPAEFLGPASATSSDKRSRGALTQYQAKRDFSRTPEPPAVVPRRSAQGSKRRFVIQKHAASHLHYDFRLEMHGALKSWAVPKGVPYARDEKRLAMATEDHPLEYLQFEGTIPQGQYGGGTVMVWDIGTYELIEGNYYKGYLRFHLKGKKLKGEWTLTRSSENGKKNWFLVKSEGPAKWVSSKRDDSSALTGRTMAAIASANDAQWHSNRPARATAFRSYSNPVPSRPPSELAGIKVEDLPRSDVKFIEPMTCTLVSRLPERENLQYEIKLDGYRALALRTDKGVDLRSRRNRPLNNRFANLARALAAIEPATVLDGEIIVLDEDGRPSFNLLQNYQTSSRPILYYVFDLLVYHGRSLLQVPLHKRREILRDIALRGTGDPIRLSPIFDAAASDLVAAAQEQRIEGIIAKRVNSVYEPGRRTDTWVKFKVNQGQELVIGGYMPGANHFDSLLVGYYEGSRLLFLGKVKNGFVPAVKEQVFRRFAELETSVCPFDHLPEPKTARRGEALTAAVMKKCRWLKPALVAQIEFTEWTAGNHLRHSKFVALQDDKPATDVHHEVSRDRG